MKLRHVWREVSDGNQTLKVLALQYYIPAEPGWHQDLIVQGGYWEDVEICTTETDNFPEDTP